MLSAHSMEEAEALCDRLDIEHDRIYLVRKKIHIQLEYFFYSFYYK